MALTPGLIARVGHAVRVYGAGQPIPAEELRDRLRAVDLVPDEDCAEFVGRPDAVG